MRMLLCFLLLLCFYPFAAAQTNHYPVVVIGGGTGGTMAAIQCARMGTPVLLVEETVWLGGMLTSAGVSAIDGNHRMPSGLWREFRDSLYGRYGGPSQLETGWVSNTLFEPAVGQDILSNMVLNEQLISLLLQTRLHKLRYENQKWSGTLFTTTNLPIEFSADILIDATELGDVASMLGLPRDIGMDSNTYSGEPWAPENSNTIVQDLTYVATLKDYGAGSDMTIPKPSGYDASVFECSCDKDGLNGGISCPQMLEYGKLPNGKYMINWPNCGNDFYLNLLTVSPSERQKMLEEAKLHTLRFVYYIQNELGFRHLGLATDEYPTEDKLPLIPYHRESGRIHGLVRFNALHVTDPFAQPEALYRTGIAVGDYPIDHHHKKNEAAPPIDFIEIKAPSFNVPLGTMIPKDHPGLIVTEKNISVSNILNGATRLQPVVMCLGQAAGVLAALAAQRHTNPAEVPVRLVQSMLLKEGAWLMPYLDVPTSYPYFAAIQRIGATGILKGTGIPYKWANQTWFYPDNFVSEFELVNGLRPLYAALAKRWDASGAVLQKPFLLNLLATLKPGFEEETLVQTWQKMGFGQKVSDNHTFTRVEVAVLLDEILRPFEISVNHSGFFTHY
jgi:hypothetical protein